MKRILIKTIEKSPLILMFFIWLYWMYLLKTDYAWNVVAMFQQRDDLYWRAFMVISIVFSLYPFSYFVDFRKQEDQNPDVKLEKKREGGMFNE